MYSIIYGLRRVHAILSMQKGGLWLCYLESRNNYLTDLNDSKCNHLKTDIGTLLVIILHRYTNCFLKLTYITLKSLYRNVSSSGREIIFTWIDTTESVWHVTPSGYAICIPSLLAALYNISFLLLQYYQDSIVHLVLIKKIVP